MIFTIPNQATFIGVLRPVPAAADCDNCKLCLIWQTFCHINGHSVTSDAQI